MENREKTLNKERERERNKGQSKRARTKCVAGILKGEKYHLNRQRLNDTKYNINIKEIIFVFAIFENKIMHLYRIYTLYRKYLHFSVAQTFNNYS